MGNREEIAMSSGNEQKFKLYFNTAVTGINPETGEWDSEAHYSTVAPLRGKVMQIDGLADCFIARYAIEITYMSNVAEQTALIKAVQKAVAEVSDMEGFFPLRGDKTPAATLESTT
jgi:hypothetical protein